MKSTATLLTKEQTIALNEWIESRGRSWKSKLHTAWQTGNYYGFAGKNVLQRIRNTLGPSWLKKAKIQDIRARADIITRESNPKRTARKKSHLWIVFKCRGRSVMYVNAGRGGARFGLTPRKGSAIFFQRKSDALSVAKSGIEKDASAKWGVISDDATATEIRRMCTGRTAKKKRKRGKAKRVAKTR